MRSAAFLSGVRCISRFVIKALADPDAPQFRNYAFAARFLYFNAGFDAIGDEIFKPTTT
jgi:hypothetical protein